MTSKLTLSVDRGVVERAKRWAAARGTSLSSLVEQYLDLVTRAATPSAGDDPPALRELRGSLRRARLGREDYRRHLERKYR